MKDQLVKSVLPKTDVTDNSGPCSGKRYTGSSKTKFNYESTHGKFKNKKQVSKEVLRQNIFSGDHNDIQDWVINFIKQVDNENFLRQKELVCVHILDMFKPNGLNQREICAANWSQGFLLINLVTVKIYLFLCIFKQYYYLHLTIITFFIRITFIYLNFM